VKYDVNLILLDAVTGNVGILEQISAVQSKKGEKR
jgi:hypothetical protein